MLQAHIVKSAIVPGALAVIGEGILIHCSPCRALLDIQRACFHFAVHGGAYDMRACRSALADVDHAVFRYDGGIEVCGDRGCRQGRIALSQLIDSGDIDRVFRQILQTCERIAVGSDSRNHLIFTVAALPVVQIVRQRVLHLLPGHHDALVFPHSRHIVRFIRLAGRLRDG